jgi:hypothetical protein
VCFSLLSVPAAIALFGRNAHVRIAAGVVKLLVRNCSAALQLFYFGDRETAAASTARCSHVIQAAIASLDPQGVCVCVCDVFSSPPLHTPTHSKKANHPPPNTPPTHLAQDAPQAHT